jgi:formamidopyrimidine-DNA glycosylase
MLSQMPELPDVTIYVERLAERCVGQTLERVRVVGPSLLRSVDPPLSAADGRRVLGMRRLGKRIVFALEEELFLIFHLMIAGRFHWRDRGARPSRKGLASLDFPTGTLILTEASTQKRAMLHLVRGEDALAEHDPGGLEVLARPIHFARLLSEPHAQRALTDPHLLRNRQRLFRRDPTARSSRQSLTADSRTRSVSASDTTRETLELWTTAAQGSAISPRR